MKYQIGLPILVLAFSGCMKIKNKDEVTSNENELKIEQFAESTQLQLSDVLIQYQGQTKPNQYSANLSWPQISGSTFRLINVNNETAETTENHFVINQMVGGKESKIIFEQFRANDQKIISNFEITLRPPEDLVFDGHFSLVENVNKNVERLFLAATTKIFTNQFDFNIKAKYLYSEFGALITNFPENSVAAMETKGLSGGKTEFKIDYAEGNLQIIMNAQQGGQGKWGWLEINQPGGYFNTPGCLPNSGSDSGNSGSFIFEASHGSKISLTSSTVVAPGGQIGSANGLILGPRDQGKLKKYDHSECQKNPTLGREGNAGQICTKMNISDNFKCEKLN